MALALLIFAIMRTPRGSAASFNICLELDGPSKIYLSLISFASLKKSRRRNMDNDPRQNTLSLILVPSIITLAILILRTVGELQHWAPAFFNRNAGGGGALV